MLGGHYSWLNECCPWLTTKFQRDNIALSKEFAGQQSQNTLIGAQRFYAEGKYYSQFDLLYCCGTDGIPCMVPLCGCCCIRNQGYELEMEGDIVAESSYPYCCPHICGPYKVTTGKGHDIGQMDPNWYCCKFCCLTAGFWQCCCTSCVTLDVKDENLMQKYNVRKHYCGDRACLCITCAEVWNIEVNGQEVGRFENAGTCCSCWCKEYKIFMPQEGTQENKKVLIMAKSYLP